MSAVDGILMLHRSCKHDAVRVNSIEKFDEKSCRSCVLAASFVLQSQKTAVRMADKATQRADANAIRKEQQKAVCPTSAG
jgi:uncharacterized protein (DUF2147 family)